MNSLLIMGYTSFDLGIFNEKDIKVSIIKKTIRRKLINFLEEGLRWIIFTGNLGFEYWALEVAKELQTDYDFQIGTIFLLKHMAKIGTKVIKLSWQLSNK